MTKIYLSSDDDFAKSPFGVMQRNRVRRGSMWGPPPNTRENKRVYELVVTHLFALCKQEGIKPSSAVERVAERVFGRAMRPSRAWESLIRSFEEARADLVASEEPIRLSIAFARGRLSALGREEHIAFRRLQETNATAARQRQYEAERQEDGGRDFFNTNTWQRLRFDVLAESEGCCHLCGRSYREHGVALEVDHIKPKSRFPSLALDKDNLQVMCFDCNRGKGNRDTTDWRADNDEAEEDKVA